jgi:hypothetical protein
MDNGILPRAFKRKKVYNVYRPQTIGISWHIVYENHESSAKKLCNDGRFMIV